MYQEEGRWKLWLRLYTSENKMMDRVYCAGTGTVINKSGIKQYQQATRDRSKVSHQL